MADVLLARTIASSAWTLLATHAAGALAALVAFPPRSLGIGASHLPLKTLVAGLHVGAGRLV
jgi:hypothetical protein